MKLIACVVAGLSVLAGVEAAAQDRIGVDCEGGETIQSALARVQNRAGGAIIFVFGTCRENLTILRGQLTIRAGAPGAAVVAADASRSVFHVPPTVQGGLVSFVGVTISGGSQGVSGDGAQVQLTDVVVSGNSGSGVSMIRNGSLRLVNTVAEYNGGSGIHASRGAHVSMIGGASRNNTAQGLLIQGGATGDVSASAELTLNNIGISVQTGSTLTLGATTVSANGNAIGGGVSVGGGSALHLEAGATITANQQSGITLTDTSVVIKSRVESDVRITNNQRWGITCSPAPATAILVGFNIQTGDMSGNGAGETNCSKSPAPLP